MRHGRQPLVTPLAPAPPCLRQVPQVSPGRRLARATSVVCGEHDGDGVGEGDAEAEDVNHVEELGRSLGVEGEGSGVVGREGSGVVGREGGEGGEMTLTETSWGEGRGGRCELVGWVVVSLSLSP